MKKLNETERKVKTAILGDIQFNIEEAWHWRNERMNHSVASEYHARYMALLSLMEKLGFIETDKLFQLFDVLTDMEFDETKKPVFEI